MTLHISSRLMATAALGALMLAAVPATAKEKAATAPAAETTAKPEIGTFLYLNTFLAVSNWLTSLS